MADSLRAQLAQPEGEGLSDEELLEIRDGAYCPSADEVNDEDDSMWQYTSNYISWLYDHGTIQEQQKYEAKGLRVVFNAGRKHGAAELLQRQHPQPPADGEVAELVEFLQRHGSAQEAADTHWAKPMLRAAELLQRQHPQPVPVAERPPGPEDVNEDGEVWIIEEGYSYALGDTGDYDWEPHRIVLRPIGVLDAKNGRTWLPAHALPLPTSEEGSNAA